MLDEEEIRLRVPNHSCATCAYYPCFLGIENCKCNFAQYGCKSYKLKKSASNKVQTWLLYGVN